MNLLDIVSFRIKIYRGNEFVGSIKYIVGIRSEIGEVEYRGFDRELRYLLDGLFGRKRSWSWNDLVSSSVQELTMQTGGRFILRFGVTPSNAGRGNDMILKRAMKRAG